MNPSFLQFLSCLTFLGIEVNTIEVDTISIEIRLPSDKLENLKDLLAWSSLLHDERLRILSRSLGAFDS